MKTRLNSLPFQRALLVTFLLCSAAVPLRAGIDINANGLSDIWEFRYPAASDPAVDTDGDGQSNRSESIAGTDPVDPRSFLPAPTLSYRPATQTLELSWVGVPGKSYQLQRSADLKAGNWTDDGEPVVGAGAPIQVERALTGQAKTYRVQVSDLDTDEDGVSDWEEILVGRNPNGPGSAPASSDGPPPPPIVNPVITVAVTQPFASEDGPTPGVLTFNRTGDPFALQFYYEVTGTALNAGTNADHFVTNGWVNLGVGVNSYVLNILPRLDNILESTESVTVTATVVLVDTAGNGSYNLSVPPGNPNAGTVIISNRTNPTGTGLRGQYYDTASANYASTTANAINFDLTQLRITRTDPTVDFNWLQGTPNGAVINSANSPDNYSVVWEGYLDPVTAGSYTFQLDADDRARVLLDTDGSGPGGLVEILEHGWSGTAETVGVFKPSAAYTLAAPATPATRYRIRVEHVETTGDARCRLQWKRDSGAFADIPSTEVFSHTSAATCVYTKVTTTTGNAVVTLAGHTLAVGNAVELNFSAGNLYSPISYSGNFSVTATTATTFTVGISGAAVPNSDATARACFVGDSISATAGWLAKYYPNSLFTAPTTLVRVDTAVTNGNTGIWGVGTPDVALIVPDTFSVRWTGQVQPQFSEEYTFVVNCDEAAKLWVNGEQWALRVAAAANSAGTYTYDGGTGNAVISHLHIPIGSFAVGESVRLDPTSGSLSYVTGSTYNYNGTTGDAVVNYTNLGITPGGFLVGETVFLDPTSGNLSALGSLPYTITAATPTTFTVNFGAGAFATGTGSINISDLRDAVVTAVGTGTMTVSFGTGKAATGSGNISIDWLNRPIDWTSASNVTVDRYARIPLVGGVRHDIRLEYFENTSSARCQLSWYSPSQPKEIIPTARLYPGSGAQQPPYMTSPAAAVALVGGAFSHGITGSNGSTITVTGLPAWLSFNGTLLTGTPPLGTGGDYQFMVTITTAVGVGTSMVNLHVEDTGGSITREFWTGVVGSAVVSIPVGTAPSGSATLTSLTTPTNFGDDYGTRIRGYITAPVTGNYYFWIAARNGAELWISSDSEPVNLVRRASVSTAGTNALQWTAQATQKSPWLALEAGQRYYMEVLHKAGVTTTDNLAVGWAKPGEATNTPSQVVPGYVLSPYVPPAPGSTPGTLYVATMLAQNGATTNGVGTSTLRMNEDETVAYMRYSHRGLTGAITSQHIHTDPYLTHASTIVFDIDAPATPGDGLITNPNDPNVGAYKWTVNGVGTLSAVDIREIVKQGKAYINLHTATYPAGEIRGNYTLAIGSRTFTPPPAPPGSNQTPSTDTVAVRFLTQATFGPNLADIAALRAMPSYTAWIDDQFLKPASQQLPEVLARRLANAAGGNLDKTLTFNAWWRNSMTGGDQLRQRVAFALSEIHVVSGQGPLDNLGHALAYFYDKLVDNAFGNFREILETTTLTPAMGRYLDMLRNDKPDKAIGRIPNENFAREIKQLFAIGLYRMWPDGSLVLNSKDEPVDTYSQREIVGFAHIFTGWDYGYDGAYRTSLGAPADWTRLMREVPVRHYTGPKRMLNNVVLPGLSVAGGQPLDPDATHSSTQFNSAAYQALPALELDAAHDQLFNHPNVGPFISRQLIQRMVTSHPSRDYVHRVVQRFNNNGSGVRGDMKAVIKAILLDYEARSVGTGSASLKPAYGKQREALMRVTAVARAFRQAEAIGTYAQTGSQVITVNVPNKYAPGNSVFLDFPRGAFVPGDTTPSSEVYTVLTTPGPSTTAFSVNARGWTGISTTDGTTNGGMSGTYSQAAGSSSMVITIANHWLALNNKAYLDFGTATTGAAMTDGEYTAIASTSTDTFAGTTFTITAPGTAARTGFVRMVRFQGTYVSANSGLPAPNDKRITLDTAFGAIADHHLAPGNRVYLNFTAGNPKPLDAEFVIESVPDSNTFTVLTSAAGTGGGNESDAGIWMFPLQSQPKTRNGNVSALASTFKLNSTDGDIDQSPLHSATVFNFFLPDYKFPGTLASQGLTTPEFQDTAETTVVRAANFLYNGLFFPGNANGISSFRSGTNALVMDLSPWMGLAVDLGLGAGAVPAELWTSNANLTTLFNRLNTLLVAGQMPTAARTLVVNYVGQRTISSITVSNPCSVTTSTAHGLEDGDLVTIAGVTGGTFSGSINATRAIARTGANTFTVPISCTVVPTSLTGATAGIIPYSNAAPISTHARDRLRAMIHLILTSPDCTIQR